MKRSKLIIALVIVISLLATPISATFGTTKTTADDITPARPQATPYLVKTGGLNTQGVILKAGGACENGQLIRYLRCADAEGSSCSDLFSSLWKKTSADDLLYYRDFYTKDQEDFFATYECYELKKIAPAPAVETVPQETPKPTTPVASAPAKRCAVTVNEGSMVKLSFETDDPDGDQLTTTYDFKQLNTVIKKKDSTFEWQTKRGDAGRYSFSATTTDGQLSETTSDCIEVRSINSAPVLRVLKTVRASEGDTVTLDATCSDADGDSTSIAFAGWMSSNTKKTNFNDAGTYATSVSCTDGKGGSASSEVTIVVANKNRAPVIKLKTA